MKWWAPVAGLLVVCAATGIGVLWYRSGSVGSVGARKATTIRAESDMDNIRAALTPPLGAGGQIVVHLWQGGRPLARDRVHVSLSRLLHPAVSVQDMLHSGHAYRAVLPITDHRWWEVVVHVLAGNQERTVPFLLRARSGPEAPAAAYPLFISLGRRRASVSLPLGSEVADLRVEIGASGDSGIQIQLQHSSSRLRARLQLRLSMLDMAMPSATVTARRIRPGRYAARVFFAMPGIWAVNVSYGRADATAALVIGKPVGR